MSPQGFSGFLPCLVVDQIEPQSFFQLFATKLDLAFKLRGQKK
jgi:hypothetical protein